MSSALQTMATAHRRAALARALPRVARLFVVTVGFLTSPQGRQFVRVAVGVGGLLAVRLRAASAAAAPFSSLDYMRALYARKEII